MADQNKRINTEREFYQDQNGNTHSSVTRSTEKVRTNPEEYRDGYTHGRIAEQNYNEENQIARDNDNAGRGLVLGIILTSVLGIAGGLLYYLSQQNNEPTPAPTTIISPAASPRATLSPTPERTIIQRERTVETSPTFIPVPQATTPAPQPNINIQTPTSTPPVNVNPDVNVTISPSPVPSLEAPSRQTSPTPTTNSDTNVAPGASLNQTATPSASPSIEAPATNSDVSPQASPDATGTTDSSSPNSAGGSNP